MCISVGASVDSCNNNNPKPWVRHAQANSVEPDLMPRSGLNGVDVYGKELKCINI